MQLTAVSRAAVRAVRRVRPGRRAAARARVALVSGVALFVLGAGVGAPRVADAADADASARFEITRTRLLLVRTDTATGQVWSVPVSGDGGWQPMGAVPGAAGEPQSAGRYQVNVIGGGSRRSGQPKAGARLLRTDLATGRAWLADADPEASWALIEGAAALPSPDSSPE